MRFRARLAVDRVSFVTPWWPIGELPRVCRVMGGESGVVRELPRVPSGFRTKSEVVRPRALKGVTKDTHLAANRPPKRRSKPLDRLRHCPSRPVRSTESGARCRGRERRQRPERTFQFSPNPGSLQL